MSRLRWPLTALGLALAGAAGLSLWLRRTSAVNPPVAGAPATTAATTHRAPLKPPAPGTGGWTAPAGSTTAPAAPAADEAPVAPAPLPRPSATAATATAVPALTEEVVWSHYQPTPEELAYRAYKVEQEANAELRNLLRVLDLDEAQQDRVFAALARSSAYYHPALQPQGAGGAPIGAARPETGFPEASPTPELAAPGGGASPSASPAAPPDPVLAVLTPEQADVYERYTSERDAFWAGVVEDIEKEINASP